jgi:hypothetical protein
MREPPFVDNIVTPTAPALLLERELPRRADGGPLASAIADALQSKPIGLEACRDLAADADEGEHPLLTDFASSGAPLSVREGATTSAPSRFVRCAMERVCQLSAPPGDAFRAVLPLRVRFDRPPAVPVPPPPPPRTSIPVDVTLTGPRANAVDDASVAVRAQVRQAAGECSASRPPPRGASLHLRVTFQKSPSDASILVPTKIESGPRGNVDLGVVGCITDRLGRMTLPAPKIPILPFAIDVVFLP